ncbi:MAG: FliM/FliN family flagellar motor switch protein, partial [Deltaproteobacteria bacterium]|nr:FliM/FliN family flagellar motor switch protein [Deltaproteobacteria bacterium]
MSDNPTRPSRPPAAPDDSVAPLPVGSADPTGASPLRGVDSLAFVMDVPVELTVVIGRRAMKIGEILRLGA